MSKPREFFIDKLSESEMDDNKYYECYERVSPDLDRYKDFIRVREITEQDEIKDAALIQALRLCEEIENHCSDGDIAAMTREHYIPIFKAAIVTQAGVEPNE